MVPAIIRDIVERGLKEHKAPLAAGVPLISTCTEMEVYRPQMKTDT